MKLKKIGVLSLGINMGAVGALFGAIAGAFIALASLLGAGASGQGSGLLGGAMGLLAIVIFPIIYGIGLFIGGLISALIYNLVFKWTGGLDVDLE